MNAITTGAYWRQFKDYLNDKDIGWWQKGGKYWWEKGLRDDAPPKAKEAYRIAVEEKKEAMKGGIQL